MRDDITVCMTMGRRPDLLRRTLDSLRPDIDGLAVLAINDFGDEATNEVFAEICPQGRRLDLGGRVGHHRAVDALYSAVTTPYIFHLEDDWLFTRHGFLPEARRLLDSDPSLSAVCFRGMTEFAEHAARDESRRRVVSDAGAYVRLDDLHREWHGFTFNPHLARKALWQSLGGFSGFKKERHVSRHVRSLGQVIAYASPGACAHIGEDDSVSVAKVPIEKRLKNWFLRS
ncbi:glycosyltransferase [Pararhodobacter zhoushanensis]|uniref:glycosyltransferase n=1 Tax=Pararhodobacter zhoushanensis TaxID=2479545 RepID=UPI000F8C628A|nr:glycosyltransferase [Pararhodobacter zhoushanensis]